MCLKSISDAYKGVVALHVSAPSMLPAINITVYGIRIYRPAGGQSPVARGAKKDTVAPKYSWFASAPAALASAPAALEHIWQLKTMAWP